MHYFKSTALKTYMPLTEYRWNIGLSYLKYENNISGILPQGKISVYSMFNDEKLPPKQCEVAERSINEA